MESVMQFDHKRHKFEFGKSIDQFKLFQWRIFGLLPKFNIFIKVGFTKQTYSKSWSLTGRGEGGSLTSARHFLWKKDKS